MSCHAHTWTPVRLTELKVANRKARSVFGKSKHKLPKGAVNLLSHRLEKKNGHGEIFIDRPQNSASAFGQLLFEHLL